MDIDILIVNSPLFRTKIENENEDSLPPLGLGYVATNLQNNGYKVEFIDAVAENLTIEEIFDILLKNKPRFIGLNVFATNFNIVRDIVEACPLPATILLGGPATRYLYNEIIKWRTHNDVIIVIGDGDLIVSDLLAGTVLQEPIYQIDSFKAYLIDTNSAYFPYDISDSPLNRAFFKNEPQKNVRGLSEVNIITSRGCIYNCAYCGSARSINQGNIVRERSQESIINELINIKNIYCDIDSVRILDDLFLKNLRNIEIAIEIFSCVNLHWRSMAHVQTFHNVTDDVLLQMKNTGCDELFIGIESGSPNILRMVNKTSDIDLIITTVTRLLKTGINVKGYFILGFPGETEQDFKLTLCLAQTLKNVAAHFKTKFRTSVFQFRPYPGTLLHKKLIKKYGKLPDIEYKEMGLILSGRNQFNFSNGNYSNCDEKVLLKYLKLMDDLNID